MQKNSLKKAEEAVQPLSRDRLTSLSKKDTVINKQ